MTFVSTRKNFCLLVDMKIVSKEFLAWHSFHIQDSSAAGPSAPCCLPCLPLSPSLSLPLSVIRLIAPVKWDGRANDGNDYTPTSNRADNLKTESDQD